MMYKFEENISHVKIEKQEWSSAVLACHQCVLVSNIGPGVNNNVLVSSY